MGSFSYCKTPAQEEVSELTVEVKVRLDSCPEGGGRLEQDRVDLADNTTDIPPISQPRVTEYRVEVRPCVSCGKRVRGQHPEMAPDQYRASTHLVGERAMAAAHTSHYDVGIPVRKVPAVVNLFTGVEFLCSPVLGGFGYL